MGILSNVKQASFVGPTRFALHTVEGFGKTTLASFFPEALFVCGERGFPRDLGRAPNYVEPKSWTDVLQLVDDLISQPHAYQSLVLDTMDWLEPLIWRFVCERDTNRKTEMNPKGSVLESIEDYGYGKGYIAAMDSMRSFLTKLDELQTKRGMHIVILMHSFVKPFHNPAGDNFDRWVPKMHERCARLVVEWCENVFFGYFEITTLKDDPKDKKAKGSSSGRRILGTRHNAMYDAKNRFNLPDTIELKNPAELMPYLLGKHIKPPMSANASTPAGKAPTPEQAKVEEKKVEAIEASTRAEPEPARSEAYQKAQPAAKESAEETERKVREAYDKAQAAKPPEADAMTDEMKRVASMLEDVEHWCGKKVRKDVEKWVSSADDNNKLAWCFQEAGKLISIAKKKQQDEQQANA